MRLNSSGRSMLGTCAVFAIVSLVGFIVAFVAIAQAISDGELVTGADAEARSDAAGIVLNKNAIPFDPQKPNIASGIRVGTPCVTTQGMGPDEMRQIAELIATAVTRGDADPDHAVSKEVRAGVTDLVTRFPAYPRG